MKEPNMWEFTVRVQRTPGRLEAWLFHDVCGVGTYVQHDPVSLHKVTDMAAAHKCPVQDGTSKEG